MRMCAPHTFFRPRVRTHTYSWQCSAGMSGNRKRDHIIYYKTNQTISQRLLSITVNFSPDFVSHCLFSQLFLIYCNYGCYKQLQLCIMAVEDLPWDERKGKLILRDCSNFWHKIVLKGFHLYICVSLLIVSTQTALCRGRLSICCR